MSYSDYPLKHHTTIIYAHAVSTNRIEGKLDYELTDAYINFFSGI